MKRLFILATAVLWAVSSWAQQDAAAKPDTAQAQAQVPSEHVELLGVKLSATPQELIDQMEENSLLLDYIDSAKHICYLSGTMGAMPITVEIRCNKNMTKINLVKMKTAPDRNQHEDYDRMLRWLRKEYDEPDWQGIVRSHRFCRWFCDFDHDIILIATGEGTVESWFYENHQQRNIDYYSILKYCEKNPSDNVPFLTAAESVTWKRNDSTTVVRRHVATRHKRRAAVRKRTVSHRKKSTRRSRGRRR